MGHDAAHGRESANRNPNGRGIRFRRHDLTGRAVSISLERSYIVVNIYRYTYHMS